jgi:hypothetical protein
VAFNDGISNSDTIEEFVYDNEIFWGTLIPHPDRSQEGDRTITDRNNERIEDVLREHVQPQMGADIITLIAQYAHHHY